MEVVCLILGPMLSLPTLFAYFLGFDVPTFHSKCFLLFLYTCVHVGLLCRSVAANVPSQSQFSSLAGLYNAYRSELCHIYMCIYNYKLYNIYTVYIICVHSLIKCIIYYRYET